MNGCFIITFHSFPLMMLTIERNILKNKTLRKVFHSFHMISIRKLIHLMFFFSISCAAIVGFVVLYECYALIIASTYYMLWWFLCDYVSGKYCLEATFMRLARHFLIRFKNSSVNGRNSLKGNSTLLHNRQHQPSSFRSFARSFLFFTHSMLYFFCVRVHNSIQLR